MIARLLTTLWVCVLPALAHYNKLEIEVTPNGRTGALHLFIFQERYNSLKVIERGTYKSLSAAMQAHNCVAGTNGGFFDPEMKPLGQIIASGRSSGRPNLSSSLTSGVIYQLNGTINIERAKSFYQKKLKPSQLIQSGPFLIENKAIVSGLSDRKFARRTVVGTNGKGDWFLAYTPPITLAQLARALPKATQTKGFQIKTALNLDGGSSSALWVGKSDGSKPFYLKEINPVANFLGVVSR